MMKKDNTLLVVVDIQERLIPAMDNSEDLLDKTVRLIKCAKALGLPILVTQQYTKGIGETVPEIKEALGDFEPIEKHTFSCMKTEEFVGKLEETGRKNVILCGVEAHVCLQQTVLELMEAGYDTCVPVDCISSRKLNDKLWAAERMETAGSVVTTYEAIAFELLEDSKAPEFKEVSAIVK